MCKEKCCRCEWNDENKCDVCGVERVLGIKDITQNLKRGQFRNWLTSSIKVTLMNTCRHDKEHGKSRVNYHTDSNDCDLDLTYGSGVKEVYGKPGEAFVMEVEFEDGSVQFFEVKTVYNAHVDPSLSNLKESKKREILQSMSHVDRNILGLEQ